MVTHSEVGRIRLGTVKVGIAPPFSKLTCGATTLLESPGCQTTTRRPRCLPNGSKSRSGPQSESSHPAKGLSQVACGVTRLLRDRPFEVIDPHAGVDKVQLSLLR